MAWRRALTLHASEVVSQIRRPLLSIAVASSLAAIAAHQSDARAHDQATKAEEACMARGREWCLCSSPRADSRVLECVKATKCQRQRGECSPNSYEHRLCTVAYPH